MADSAGSSTLNSDVGVGVYRACINCDDAIDSAYAEEVLGISKW